MCKKRYTFVVKFSVIVPIMTALTNAEQHAVAAMQLATASIPIRPTSVHTGFEKWVARPWQNLGNTPFLQIYQKKQEATLANRNSAAEGEAWMLSTEVAKENKVPLRGPIQYGYDTTATLEKQFDIGVHLKLSGEASEVYDDFSEEATQKSKTDAQIGYDFVRGGSNGVMTTTRRYDESKADEERLQVEADTLTNSQKIFESLIDAYGLQCKRVLVQERLDFVKQLIDVARAKSKVKLSSGVNLLEMQNLDSSLRRDVLSFENDLAESVATLESHGLASQSLAAYTRPSANDCLQPLLRAKFIPYAPVTRYTSTVAYRLVKEKERTATLNYLKLDKQDLPRLEVFVGARHTRENKDLAYNTGLVGLRFDLGLGQFKNFWATYAAYKNKESAQSDTLVLSRALQSRLQTLNRRQTLQLQILEMLRAEIENNEKVLKARKNQFQIGTADVTNLKQNIFEAHALHGDLLDTWTEFEKIRFQLAQLGTAADSIATSGNTVNENPGE